MKFIKIEDVEYHGKKRPVYLNIEAIQAIVPATKNGEDISLLLTNCPRLEHSELVVNHNVEQFLDANSIEIVAPFDNMTTTPIAPEPTVTVVNNVADLNVVAATPKQRGRKRSENV